MVTALNRCLWLCVCGVVFFFLTGCALVPQTLNKTREISDSLDQNQDNIYKSFNVQPADLSLRSKCNAPPSVKIVNNENRTENYVVFTLGKITWVVNPKEIMDSVSVYLKRGFEKSHIKVDDKSTKILQLKMVDLQSAVGMWTSGGYFKMELIIPKKNFSKFYEAKEDMANKPYTAYTYPIHSVTREIIDDPLIQDYILCK